MKDRDDTPDDLFGRGSVAAAMAAIGAALFFVLSNPAQSESRDAIALLNKVDDLYRGESSQGQMTMTIVTENWTRTLTAEMASKGKDNSLIRILAPKKEKGTATLRVDRDIWNYLPKVDRVIKLPSSMMSVSWMGSHVTNNDLVRESRFEDDFTCTIEFEGNRDGKSLIQIDCIPLEDAAVEWGKVTLELDGATELPLRALYFDEDLDLSRTITYENVREVGGRDMPTTMKVTPADEPGESTTVSYDELNFDVQLEDSFFSLRRLKES